MKADTPYRMNDGNLETRLNQNYINGRIVSEKEYKAYNKKSKSKALANKKEGTEEKDYQSWKNKKTSPSKALKNPFHE